MISQKSDIAIVGGGIIGIAAALELAKTELFNITIFEKDTQMGGLSSYYQWDDSICDRFYHVILPNDTETINFIKELGLGEDLYWKETKSGFYGDGELVSLSSTKEFLQFPFLSFSQKIRLGLGIIYANRLKNSERLDHILAKEWLVKTFGRQVYEVIWAPLLRSKLGDASEKIPASYIWAIINRLYKARQSSSKKEQMGYVRGGYHAIIKSAEAKLTKLQVKLLKNSPVTEVVCGMGQKVIVKTRTHSQVFDNILFTLPNPDILSLWDEKIYPDFARNLKNSEYLDIICLLFVLKQKLSPFYVINLLDGGLPFTGIVETSNVMFSEEINNRHLVYLPKYLTGNDPLQSKPDEYIYRLFKEALKTIFPNLMDSDILHAKIFRNRFVNPIYASNKKINKLAFQTPFFNVYIANSVIIQDSTLNNNASIDLAKAAAMQIIFDKKTQSSS